ncbi:uncharacterized protein LOC115921344 [Strongylocentrotus purpuratus]|uniref:Uncharacterized protein n=1 Tax=Strongylocentrotus purpuratus TaxID=7668 RepID=A0A7M7NEP9_STRPU|nr:uncharacterized protein LOC115921344 [Strongylocentrotus purpuratus]
MQVETLKLYDHKCPTPASSYHLSETLCSMPHLTYLRLYGGDLREEFYSTWKANASSIKVETLKLDDHKCPTPASSYHLSETLCSMPHLTYLRLYEGDLREEFYSTWKANASSIKVETLKLDDHKCPTPASSHHLSEALCSMPNLTDLRLDGGDLCEEFYSTLKAKASSIKVQTLKLTNHKFRTPSSHHLLEALCSMPNLTNLRLDGGDLREEFYSTLKAKASSIKVQTLNLTNHQCRTPASSHHLSEALCSMPHLTDLTLDGGDLREEFYSTWKANAPSIKVCVS